jgi:ankyrin repeat protein
MNIIAQLAPIAIEQGTKYVSKRLTTPGGELATEASNNNTVALRSMLKRNPNINRAPALVSAAALGHLKALDILLEPPKASSRDRDSGHESTNEGPDVNVWAQSTTPLLAAVKEHHSKTTKLLLEAGADPNLAFKDGTTALQLAVQSGDIEIAKLLLAHGAEINHHNGVGDTALIITARYGHANTAKFLIAEGARVNARNDKNSTALLVAARHDCVDVLQVLLKNGANVNARDKSGRGPLHRAVAGISLIEGVPVKTKMQIVEMLLEAGADPGLRDGGGKTAGERAGWFVGGEGLRKLLEVKKTYDGSRDRTRERARRANTF